jgi:hypothetical protein
MDSQGPTHDVGPNNPLHVSTAKPPVVGAELRAQGSSIPPPPFFPSFPQHGSQMPFLYPHSFMPLPPGVGFAPPVHGVGSGIADIAASQKRSSQECAIDQSKTNKKHRVTRKKLEIVGLDDVKDEVEVLKTPGHWKEHWVIQLINIQGEMHSTFSAPPKQGDVCHSHFFMVFSSYPKFSLPAFHMTCSLILEGFCKVQCPRLKSKVQFSVLLLCE